MDLQCLKIDRVISQDTLDWLAPLEQEEKSEKLARNEAAVSQIFDALDENNNDDSLETLSLCFSGATFRYSCDLSASGHANVVWGASLAMCLYLQTSWINQNNDGPQRVLELGAGAAIPSLFLANILSSKEHKKSDGGSDKQKLVHITDVKRYHNIKPLLMAVSLQADSVRQHVRFKVSPHNWGESVATIKNGDGDAFLLVECGGPNMYDVVLVSDCIYNPEYHELLLDSICGTLKKPHKDKEGGRVIVSFSLHGNCPEENVWAFFDKALKRNLNAQHVPNSTMDGAVADGWNMECTAKELGIWRANLDPSRWIAYIYELSWALSPGPISKAYSPVFGE